MSSAKKKFRVLGVDTSLRSSGIGIVDGVGRDVKAVTYGTIKNKPSVPHSECLWKINREIRALIEQYEPDAVAVEGIFFFKNAKTAMILGQARGAVLSVCAEFNKPVCEYAPRLVKQSIVGTGRAEKAQVGAMVQRLLNLPSVPSSDAADALAIAMTHLHQLHLPAELQTKPI